jgi:hypothetical protein
MGDAHRHKVADAPQGEVYLDRAEALKAVGLQE